MTDINETTEARTYRCAVCGQHHVAGKRGRLPTVCWECRQARACQRCGVAVTCRWQRHCGACACILKKENYARRVERNDARSLEGERRCPACGAHKPVDQFHRHRGRNSGVSICRPCAAARRARRKIDPIFLVTERLRHQLGPNQRPSRRIGANVREATRARGGVLAFLGFTAQQLRDHIEARFTDDMSWKAFAEGRVHLDHVTALRYFDLNSEYGVRAAWRLDNLQPMWPCENLDKHLSADRSEPIRLSLEQRIAEHRASREPDRG